MKEINYDEIDKLCIPLVKLFNKIGLRTKFSCQGHDEFDRTFYIMFHESVKDAQIYRLNKLCAKKRIKEMKYYGDFWNYGKFLKWVRYTERGYRMTNWIYQIDFPDYKYNHEVAKNAYILLTRILNIKEE